MYIMLHSKIIHYREHSKCGIEDFQRDPRLQMWKYFTTDYSVVLSVSVVL